jgi:hypothetical protein
MLRFIELNCLSIKIIWLGLVLNDDVQEDDGAGGAPKVEGEKGALRKNAAALLNIPALGYLCLLIEQRAKRLDRTTR